MKDREKEKKDWKLEKKLHVRRCRHGIIGRERKK